MENQFVMRLFNFHFRAFLNLVPPESRKVQATRQYEPTNDKTMGTVFDNGKAKRYLEQYGYQECCLPQLQKEGNTMIIHRFALGNGSVIVTNLNQLKRQRVFLTTLLQIAEISGLRVWRAPGAKFAFGEFQQLGLVFSAYIGTPFHVVWHK
jgi:hypothetical protein